VSCRNRVHWAVKHRATITGIIGKVAVLVNLVVLGCTNVMLARCLRRSDWIRMRRTLLKVR
jgi:hypothetical protein